MRKVRITGGEPTVRRDLLDILRTVAAVPGVQKVALSTNGASLKSMAKAYQEAGVSALNVSVDSLDSAKFRLITGQDRLHDILDGIDLALDAGIASVKINTVILKGTNDGEFDDFLAYVKSRPVSVRFIELMRTGDNAAYFEKHHLGAPLFRRRLEEAGWVPVLKKPDDGPAVEFMHPDYQGKIGLIAPYSTDFCKTCNRLRVSSQGDLRLCLFGDRHYSLRSLLQAEGQREELLETMLRLIGHKQVSHLLAKQLPGSTRRLAEIGG
jgi:cyclic pyranopterin phosphate synthase